MKFINLHIKPLLFTLLTMLMVVSIASCKDDDNEVLQAGYGYVQFKLFKSASAPEGTTRSVSELQYLNDAKKMKIVLMRNNSTITQTVSLGAISGEAAEYGLTSEKLQLLAGEYRILGYYLYDKVDEQLIACEPDEETFFTVINGGLQSQNLTVNAVKRGKVNFTLVKDMSEFTPQTRGGSASRAYTFDEVRYADITVKNAFSGKESVLRKIKFTFTQDFDDSGTGHRTSYAVSDSILSLVAGTYSIVAYTTYDKDSKLLEFNNSNIKENTFIVEDNEKTEADVPVKLYESDDYIKDYYALKEIWESLNGKDWYYYGDEYQKGANWNFNKDVDLWGDQPGVSLNAQGRVAALNIGGFAPKGDMSDRLGDLTELRVLTIGTHSDAVGGSLIEKAGARVLTAEEKKAIRMDYANKFLTQYNALFNFSDPIKRGFAEQGSKVTLPKLTPDNMKDVNTGDLTNGVTSIPETIGNCIKLEQLYIANGLISKLPWGVQHLINCTDVEIYNCPKMENYPNALNMMPNIELLNIANNPQWTHEVLFDGLTRLADGAGKEKLQMLYCGGNNLEEIPENFKNIVKFGMLDMSYNKIKKLHPFGKGINFVQLFLNNNEITEIPRDAEGVFCGVADVEDFNFSHNKLTKLPDLFTWNTPYVMSSVNFAYNEISEIENGSGYHGIMVTTLDLSYNRFTTFPALFTETANSGVEQLNLAGNGIEKFPDGSLKGKNVYWLSSLDLSYNKLSELPKEFTAQYIPYLYGIDLSYNRFNKFPVSPLNVSRLTVYAIRGQRDAKGNRSLTEWPKGLYTCPSLRAFYISSNDLRKIDDTISYLIYYFDISDNPNISIDLSAVCPYIRSGAYILAYDRTQDIRGCDALDLEN